MCCKFLLARPQSKHEGFFDNQKPKNLIFVYQIRIKLSTILLKLVGAQSEAMTAAVASARLGGFIC